MLLRMNCLCQVLLVTYLIQTTFANQSEEELCATVKKINCQNNYASKSDELICADNGETYLNRCFFVQAKCHDKDIDIVCQGNCTQCTKSDTNEETTKDQPLPDALSLTKSPPGNTKATTESELDRIQRYDLNQSTNNTEINTERRRLQQETSTTNKDDNKLTTGHYTTMSFEERIYNLTGLNITRMRKDPQGHHVDQSTGTTARSNPKPSCMGIQCNAGTMKDKKPNNGEVPCERGNCSKSDAISLICSSNNCSGQTTASLSKQSLLVTVLAKTTRQHSSQRTVATTPTLFEIISTTKKPGNPIEASYTTVTIQPTEFDLEAFCVDVDTKLCPKTLDPLCGTDNKFYLNICTFNKAKCKDKNLQIQDDLSTCRRKSRL